MPGAGKKHAGTGHQVLSKDAAQHLEATIILIFAYSVVSLRGTNNT